MATPAPEVPAVHPLQVEHDAISERLEKASAAEKPVLEAQFGERLQHLKARLATKPVAVALPKA